LIQLNGGQKSGSGTIVRYASSLCALSRQNLHLYNIRARRDKPGLRPQHLMTLTALLEICGGTMEGGQVGSRELVFYPGKEIRSGSYNFDIKTSGSATMLVLSLLPVLAYAHERVELQVAGGTFQDFAPSVFHLQRVLFPLLVRMGLGVSMEMVRPGYLPRGQGILKIEINPLQGRKLKALSLPEQGEVTSIEGIALSSHLREREVSSRLAAVCINKLEKKGFPIRVKEIWDESALQPGASLALWAETETGCLLGADMAGKPRRSSEYISRYVTRTLLEDLRSGATVDRFLADQLVIFAALAQGETRYLVPGMTEHLETNLWLVSEILGARVEVEDQLVKIKGVGMDIK